jgi:hypothetical protein
VHFTGPGKNSLEPWERNLAIMKKSNRKTIEDLIGAASKRNGTCLDSKYKGIKAHYQWECQFGHQWPAIAESVLRGSWCPTCAGQRKTTIEELQSICENKGGKLLSTNYVNQHTNYEVICSKGHLFQPQGQTLVRGGWCKKCQLAELWAKRPKVSIEDYQKAGLEVGCILLDAQIPERTTTKAQWRCKKEGHVFPMTYNNIKNHKQHCPKCSGRGKVTMVDCKVLAESRGGKILTTEYNPYELQTWECKHGHSFSSKYSTIKSQKVWCPYCSSGVGERVCRFVFESLFGMKFQKIRPDWLLNEKGNRLELDGFCGKLKIAFEHNGKQHYSEKYHRGTHRLIQDDLIKIERCKQNGITLIVVPEIPSLIKFEDCVDFIISELEKYGIQIPNEAVIPKVDSSFRWTETVEDERAQRLEECKQYIASKNAILSNVELVRRGKQYVFVFDITTRGGGKRSLTEHKLMKDSLWSEKMIDPLTGEEFYRKNGQQKFASKQNSLTYNNMKKLGRLGPFIL